MKEEEIMNGFAQGFACSQLVFSSIATELGLDEKIAKKLSSCMHGWMYSGCTCGVVNGAFMALGMKYGNSEPRDPAQIMNDKCMAKANEFKDKFLKLHNSFTCKGLLGYDYSIPEERKIIFENNIIPKICPKIILDSLTILEELL